VRSDGGRDHTVADVPGANHVGVAAVAATRAIASVARPVAHRARAPRSAGQARPKMPGAPGHQQCGITVEDLRMREQVGRNDRFPGAHVSESSAACSCPRCGRRRDISRFDERRDVARRLMTSEDSRVPAWIARHAPVRLVLAALRRPAPAHQCVRAVMPTASSNRSSPGAPRTSRCKGPQALTG
jgi:hypothetical protein